MEQLTIADLNNQQLVDVRQQLDYQAGHLADSYNLNPKNFKKYAHDFLATDLPLVFFVGEETDEEMAELERVADELGFTQIDGYLRIADVSREKLQKTNTISADEFLKKSDDYILLDIRHPDEITRPAPKKNLVNIALEDLPESFQTLDSGKEIFTLCGSGNRSTTAASYLATKGLDSTVVAGGMKAIQEVENKEKGE